MQTVAMLMWCDALEENFLVCLRALLKGKQGAEIVEVPDWSAYSSGIAFPMYNGILYRRDFLGVGGVSHDKHLKARIEQLRGAGLPFLVSVASSYRIEPKHWKKMGLRSVGSVPAMIRPLDEELHWDKPQELTIERVETQEELALWVDIQSRGFGFPRWVGKETFALLSASLGRGEVSLYLGRWLGEPMVVSMGVRSGEMVGVYNVAVLPRGRRHGMGGAMTAHTLEEGRKAGAKTASLQASAEGLSLYQKMGFVVVGRFDHYLSASPLQWLDLAVGTFFRQLKGSWERMRHPLPRGEEEGCAG